MGAQTSGRQSAILNVTIANGQSVSDVVEIANYALAAIIMPAAWTAAALTFQAVDGVGAAFDVYDDAGTEVSITSTNAVAGRCLVNKTILEQLSALRRVKVRSGTTGTPVAQGAARVVQLVLKS